MVKTNCYHTYPTDAYKELGITWLDTKLHALAALIDMGETEAAKRMLTEIRAHARSKTQIKEMGF
jgi:hypothetical protein